MHPDTKTVGKGAQKRNRRASVLPGGGIAGEGKRVLGSVRSGGRTVKLQDLCWIKQECGHVLVKVAIFFYSLISFGFLGSLGILDCIFKGTKTVVPVLLYTIM